MAKELSQTRILIVEDEQAIREAMHDYLTLAGFTAFKAASAEAALEMIDHQPLDLVITDIILPGMSGLDLTGKIKKAHDDIDVIVMTGYSGDYSYEEAVSKGASDFVFKPIRFEELVLRIRRVLREQQLRRDRARMLEKLNTLAITDGLTKLYNSRHFYNQLKGEMDRATRYRHPLALLLLDIDYFKEYNDRFGHLEGDNVLSQLAQLIRSCLRTMDTAYRYGGEEFTIILPETTAAEAGKVAERLRANVEKTAFNPSPEITRKVTISIGVTHFQPGESCADLIRRADQAMYLSKANGRNRVSTLLPAKTDAT